MVTAANDSARKQLLDLCLQRIDAELYEYMKSKGLQAEVYAFPSILTFSACTPPLDQVLELWDFLLAFGVHLNVLCVVAQLYLIRDEIMTEIRCVLSDLGLLPPELTTLPRLQPRQDAADTTTSRCSRDDSVMLPVRQGIARRAVRQAGSTCESGISLCRRPILKSGLIASQPWDTNLQM